MSTKRIGIVLLIIGWVLVIYAIGFSVWFFFIKGFIGIQPTAFGVGVLLIILGIVIRKKGLKTDVQEEELKLKTENPKEGEKIQEQGILEKQKKINVEKYRSFNKAVMMVAILIGVIVLILSFGSNVLDGHTVGSGANAITGYYKGEVEQIRRLFVIRLVCILPLLACVIIAGKMQGRVEKLEVKDIKSFKTTFGVSMASFLTEAYNNILDFHTAPSVQADSAKKIMEF